MKKTQLEALKKVLCPVLKRHSAIELATVYGSVARGRETPSSDIDIAVAASRPLDAKVRMALAQDLEGVLGRDVDLLDLQRAHGVILYQALSGEFIYHRSPDDRSVYADLLKRWAYEEADLMPITRRVQRIRRERFLNESRRPGRKV